MNAREQELYARLVDAVQEIEAGTKRAKESVGNRPELLESVRRVVIAVTEAQFASNMPHYELTR